MARVVALLRSVVSGGKAAHPAIGNVGAGVGVRAPVGRPVPYVLVAVHLVSICRVQPVGKLNLDLLNHVNLFLHPSCQQIQDKDKHSQS
uniref:Uncharacterized protein n=1 Tax=Ixodes ricinus TaxID=34613 RepID=A0A147BU39_IXORI